MGGFVKDLLSAGKSLIPGVEKEAEPLLKKAGDVLEQRGEQFMKGLHDEQALNSIRKDVKFHPMASDVVGKPSVVDKGIVKHKLDIQKPDLPPNFFKNEYKNGIDSETRKIIHRVTTAPEHEVKSYQTKVSETTKRIAELDKLARQALDDRSKLFNKAVERKFKGTMFEPFDETYTSKFTKEYLDYKAEGELLTQQQNELWDKYYKYVDERKALRKSLENLKNPYIGELRELTNGQPVMWLSKDTMDELASALDPIAGHTYTLNGVRLRKEQTPQILNRIVKWVSDQDKARGLIRLFNEAAQKTSGEGYIVVSKQNRGLRFAIDTVREELLHDWQGSLAGGNVPEHLKPETFTRLAKDIPLQLAAEMVGNKYSIEDNKLAVFEASAKILSGSVDDKAILKHPDTAKFITKYFEAVEQEHGVDALERIRYAINDFKKMRDKYVESKRAIESEAAKGQ